MTFSQEAKSEVIKSLRNVKTCCAQAFLAAVLKASGSLLLEHRGYGFCVESDNTDLLDLCVRLAERHFGVAAQIETSNVNVKGVPVYSCTFGGKLGEALGLTLRDENGVLQLCGDPAAILPDRDCCKRAFMQGLFLSCGSVMIPMNEQLQPDEKYPSKYHLELRFTDATFASAVSAAYAEMGFRSTTHRGRTVLYLKNSERIADFLVYVNAMAAKLRLENVMVVRDVRNSANRQRNCIAANIEKSVAAGGRQLQSIRALRAAGYFDGLPDSLKEIALLREQYPEANLEEIAAMLGISKSGANHRLAKLIELAQRCTAK